MTRDMAIKTNGEKKRQSMFLMHQNSPETRFFKIGCRVAPHAGYSRMISRDEKAHCTYPRKEDSGNDGNLSNQAMLGKVEGDRSDVRKSGLMTRSDQ